MSCVRWADSSYTQTRFHFCRSEKGLVWRCASEPATRHSAWTGSGSTIHVKSVSAQGNFIQVDVNK
jgi:hypothetical protein